MLYINICKKNQANIMLIRCQKRACVSQIRVQASLIHNKTIILFTELTIQVVICLRIIKFAKVEILFRHSLHLPGHIFSNTGEGSFNSLSANTI